MSSRTGRIVIILLTLSAALIFYYLATSSFEFNYFETINEVRYETKVFPEMTWEEYSRKTNFSKLSSFFNSCRFRKIDPFDESIRRFIDFRGGEHYEANCDKNFKVISSLKNGTISLNYKNLTCFGRCLLPGKKYRDWPITEKWLPTSNSTFTCDVVEVICRYNGTSPLKEFESNPDYRMLHTQVYTKKKNRSPPQTMKDKKQYNVIVYLLDAMGSTAAERYLPRTLRYLEKSMKAIKFENVNRVAFSSKHNGFTLFYGKTMEEIDRLGFARIIPDETEDSICRRSLDNDTSIFHKFQEMGYVTMFTDDYDHGLFAWPNCKAIRQHIMDYTFDQLLTYQWHKNIKELFHGYGCQHAHKFVNTMTKQVFEAYPDKPKFIWNWLVRITHDKQYAAHVIDRDFVEFIHENRKMIDESFFIIMADHGCRGCPVAKTDIGKFEYNNPLYTIAVPKELRTPEILGMLKENSEKLQSHYDTRATLLDILQYQPKENFIGQEYIKIEGERGSSLLRNQPGERNCFTLPIPFQYCICEQNITKADTKSEEAIKYGKMVINHVNSLLKERNMTEKCMLWEFNKVTDLKLESFKESQILKIVVNAKPYTKAQIITTMWVKDQSYSFGTLDRVDRFEKRNDCDRSKLQAMCDCRSNWVNTTTNKYSIKNT